MRTTTRKLAAVAAISAAALGAAPAAVALADGPGTRESPAAAQRIQQLNWPQYQRGDSGEDIRAAQHLLRGYSLEPTARYDIPTDGGFDAVTEQALRSFQGWRGVPVTGKLDPPTWRNFSSELETKPIDGDHGNNAEHVTAVQVLLNKHRAGIAEDGIFGSNTRAAVKNFQADHDLRQDGDVGPLTFKALVATPPPDAPTEAAAVTRPASTNGTVAPKVAKNPYTPTEVCGPGFYVVDDKGGIGGKAKRPITYPDGSVVGYVYLLYKNSTGKNCAVTIKTSYVGEKTAMKAALLVEDGRYGDDFDWYKYYAGPVKKKAAGECVKYWGSINDATGGRYRWGNCG